MNKVINVEEVARYIVKLINKNTKGMSAKEKKRFIKEFMNDLKKGDGIEIL